MSAVERTDALAVVARSWIDNGFPAFPVALRWNPAKNGGAGSIDKRPLTNRGHIDATLDPDELGRLFASARLGPGEELGVGIVPGTAGYVVLDCDTKDDKPGLLTLEALQARHGDFARYRYRTPSGGLNVMLRKPAGAAFGNHQPPDWPGVDVRADGGWVVAPGTCCSWGEWREEFGELADVVELPAAMAAQLREAHETKPSATTAEVRAWLEANAGPTTTEARQRFEERLASLRAAANGSRHQALMATVGWVVGMHHLDHAEALVAIRAEWDQLTAGEGRENEPIDCLHWVIPQEQAKRASQVVDPSWMHEWAAANANGKADANANADAPPSPSARATLPLEFWQARPALTTIRQAAHARQRSADAVLHVVLARIAAAVSHTLQLPAIVGSPAPLCHFAVILAPPGVGKGNASAIGGELVPLPARVSQVPLGSGEGLVELLFEWTTEDDGTGKNRKVKRQTKHNAFVYVDEGQALAELGRRSGSTLMPTLRSIWSGGMIGNANAAQENKRIVPAGQYTFGIVVGMQDSKAGPLLDDADGGTPQRFAWATATAPDLADTPPPWPGPLAWQPPTPMALDGLRCSQDGYVRHELIVAPEIRAEILAADLARQRGQVVVTQLDAHAELMRLKMAALLALLEDRLEVTGEDWALAGMMKETSNAVRTRAGEAVAADAGRREQIASGRNAARAAAAASAVEVRRTVDCARAIARKVHAEPERWTVTDLRRGMPRWRREYEDGLLHAIAEGWVIEQAEPGQGAERRSLVPGTKPPR